MTHDRLPCPSSTRTSLLSTSQLLLVGLLVGSAALGGCDSEPSPSGPDAAPPPLVLTGRYAITSELTLAAPPDAAARALAELAAITDDPADPSRFLIDLMIERLPLGPTRSVATLVAPYVAAFVNDRIATIAPTFVAGVHALGAGLDRVAHGFGTIEELRIDVDGRAHRTLEGLRFGAVEIPFAPLGLPSTASTTSAAVAGDRLTIAEHAVGVAYGQVLRLGLDHAVIPGIVPGVADLGGALRALVDCPHLGGLVANRVGIGSPALYAEACTLALASLAQRIYGRLPPFDAPTTPLVVVGTARAVDRDGDGVMDAIDAGTWTGTFAQAPLGRATFAGTTR